ncbi:hypothetical protein EWM64_g3711 [Hericium alpestre]|uniref:Uncharacterized protein n=1 Tax=Hericium alpestre TaxID=135208 RepID=A0A4Z0A255_9AGAM|nr:hypothetical protein EWM64_g3711 [Hericium alpestre]
MDAKGVIVKLLVDALIYQFNAAVDVLRQEPYAAQMTVVAQRAAISASCRAIDAKCVIVKLLLQGISHQFADVVEVSQHDAYSPARTISASCRTVCAKDIIVKILHQVVFIHRD